MWRRTAADTAHGRRFWPLWVGSLALPLFTLAGVALLSWWREQDVAAAQLRTDIALLQEHTLRAFDTQIAVLAAMRWQTRDMSWEEISGSTELADLLRDLAENAVGTSAVGIIRPDGRLAHISSAPFPPPAIDFSDRDYVRHQQGPQPGPYLSAPLIGRVRGRAAFSYSVPRRDAAGRPDGGLFWTTFRQDDFRSVYAAMLEGTRGEIALLRRHDATILASHPPLPDLGRAPQHDAAGMGEVARAALATPGETVLLRGPSPLDGEARLYAARALRHVPAVVVKGLHPSDVVAVWRREMAGLAALAAAAGLMLLWLTWRTQRAAMQEARALDASRVQAERRAEAEAALRQGQRLRMLGEVVAGVAHDFRNTIQAVQSGVTLARKAVEAGDTQRAARVLAMTGDAVFRGGQHVEHMMRSVRGDGGAEADRATIDPVAALTAVARLLGRTLPAGYPVSLDIRHEELPGRVRGGMAEFEAALLNLAFNARDAMPDGGTIRLSLAAGAPGGESGRPPDGWRHAGITVADAGIGMDAATLARIATPFFTTKPPGKGTGLGLTSARAFAQSVGGALVVQSEGPGRGTAVTLWLPEATSRSPAPDLSHEAATAGPPPRLGKATPLA